ncbi:MAG: Ig-like domain-containing protein [Candidatus Coproplasma sp.]
MKGKFLVCIALAAALALGCFSLTGCNLSQGGSNTGETVSVESVSVSPDALTLDIGAERTLTATVLPENATNKNVNWASSDTSVAPVADGKVTALKAGTATITATSEDGGKSATCQVTVNAAEPVETPAISGVLAEASKTAATVGDIITLTATVSGTGDYNRNVSWAITEGGDKATLNGNLLTVTAAGTVKVQATAEGDTTKKSNEITITVSAAEPVEPSDISVESVSLTPDALILDIGAEQTLAAIILPEDATNKNVIWISSNTSVVAVDNGGKVTAIAEGSATVTVRTEDGGKSATCRVTVNSPAVDDTVKVDGVTVTPATLSLNVNGEYTLVANVSPSDATNKNVIWTSSNTSVVAVDNGGKVTAIASGGAEVTVTTEDGNFTGKCVVTVSAPESGELALTYSYGGNECAAFEWADATPANASVKYKLATETNYTTLDSQLIRLASASGYARADIVGLKGGANYEFVITSSAGKTVTVTKSVTAYDRSGYAHFNYNSGVGAYNDDGTLKSNAVVVYVTEATKNTVKATVNGKERTGIVSILQNAGTSTPLVVRVIGTIGAATWKQGNVEYTKTDSNTDSDYNLLPEAIVGANGTALAQQTWTQADLISGGYNELDTSVYSELIGLSSQIKWDSSNNEFDSCWNNCSVSGVKNVTLEGIGEDARLFQWGITWKQCSSIEVRNLTFEDYTEDACSVEGGSSESTSATPSDFSTKNFWIHNNTFEEGVNYWDVCKEQDKHDGDGSTDLKYCAFVTLSYNQYNSTHKTGLVGGSNSNCTASVTFHHNYYNACVSRLPLARQANMHMYNNYYSGTTSSDLSLRANAYAFVENCYFESGNTRPVELQYDEINGNGAAKLVNCVINQSNIFIASGVSNSNLYVGSDRLATVTNTNKYGTTFDTDTSLFYYDSVNKKTDVSVMYTAEETKVNVPLLAGVQKRNGITAIDPEGGNQGGSSSGGETGETIPTYSEMKARDDIVYSDDFSSYAEGYKFAEFTDYNTAGIYSIPDSTLGYSSSYTEVSGGKTNQVTNGANTVTAIAFGSVDSSSVIEGYFEITTTDVGSKWELIRFVSDTGVAFAVRIDTSAANPLTYTVNGGSAVTPSQTFVWVKNTTYKVYFKIDTVKGEITVNITDGTDVYNVQGVSIGSDTVRGIQLTSSNKGQRYTSIDNLVICAS